ncbi:hypothetical protein ElyMa_005173600 [Elysia marginata]|uniref:Peptidase S1 domain-containing protein n=1 Tax=Elysia marginata TaxID=1093978 RepID=A0AAV4JQL8_9GAST|nr:hypothetical protein ElyMa_005173600 [Elysia marginata]
MRSVVFTAMLREPMKLLQKSLIAFVSIQKSGDRKSIEDQKKDQGLHECEVFGSWPANAESTFAWDNCTKTQNNHRNFVPFSEFCEKNLPSHCIFKESLANYIKTFASLVVRLRINYVSTYRPDGYTFARSRGAYLPHLGTGWVYRLKRGIGHCPCQICLNNPPSSSPDWWDIEVFTACHVVYDKQEAQWTSVDFFHNDDNSEITTVLGYDVKDNDPRNDVCILRCATHDKHLFQTLEDAMWMCYYLKKDIKDALLPSLCVVISHPHGKPKKITVGEIAGKADFCPEESLMADFMYTYSAETCNGSSGAPVLCSVGQDYTGSEVVWPGAGPHSWGNVRGGLNQCGSGAFYVEETEEEEEEEIEENY